MNKDEEIRAGLRNLLGGKTRERCFVGIVESNYPDLDHADVRDLSGTLYPDVRKRAAIKDGTDGILITPSAGSTVLVSRIGESDELFIEMYSEIESLMIDGGKNGGLTITPALVKELAKLTRRVDGIIQALQNGKVGVSDGGAALLASILAGLGKLTEKEDFSKIENVKIKH